VEGFERGGVKGWGGEGAGWGLAKGREWVGREGDWR